MTHCWSDSVHGTADAPSGWGSRVDPENPDTERQGMVDYLYVVSDMFISVAFLIHLHQLSPTYPIGVYLVAAACHTGW